MLKNVNLLQNPIEYDKYIEEYIIQALANSGQRIGIKGDGVSYKHFTFKDLLESDATNTNEIQLGYIKYNDSKDTAAFGISTIKDNGGIIDKTYITSVNVNNTLYFPSELSFDILIGNIEKYSKNSICINDGSELTFMLAGKLIGFNDKDDFNTVLHYYKFDIDSNLLKYGAKLYHINQEDNIDYYCLLTIVNTEYESNNYDKDSFAEDFKMNIYIFNSNIFGTKDSDQIYKDTFKNIFNYSSYSETNEIPFSLIRQEYKDVNELLDITNIDNKSNLFAYSPIAVVQYFINLQNNSQNNYVQNIPIEYNVNSEFYIHKDNIYDTISESLNSNNIILDEVITLLNEDIINLYHNILSYYNEKYYLVDKKELIKKILMNIYDKLLTDNKIDNPCKLYIPLDYKFNYFCNSNDNMYIYYSPNIFITCTNLSDNKSKITFLKNNHNLIFDYNDDIDKVKTYSFEFIYNDENVNIINSINIIDTFTMPYINAENNWNVNENNTSVKATGLDAGNPNIIVIHSKNRDKGSYQILSIVSSKEANDIIKNAEFKLKDFNISEELFLNHEENVINGSIPCGAYIPEINDNNIEYFKYSIILSISDLDCFDIDTNKNYIKALYKGTHVLTLWHVYTDKDNNSTFESVKDINNNTLILSSSINIKNNKLLHSTDSIVLNAIINKLAQVSKNTDSYNHFVIRNKKASEYNSNYTNNLNVAIQCSDSLSDLLNEDYNEKNLIDTLQENKSKYITTLNNLNVTNSLYSKYSNNNEYVFNDNVPSLDFSEVLNRNFNVINRLNIISLSNTGKAYNAYIGSSSSEKDKDTLHIGTTQTNINLGNKSLIDSDKEFNIHNNLSIDFNEIKLNSKKLISNKPIIRKETIGDTDYYIVDIIPIANINDNLFTTIVNGYNGIYLHKLINDYLFIYEPEKIINNIDNHNGEYNGFDIYVKGVSTSRSGNIWYASEDSYTNGIISKHLYVKTEFINEFNLIDNSSPNIRSLKTPLHIIYTKDVSAGNDPKIIYNMNITI